MRPQREARADPRVHLPAPVLVTPSIPPGETRLPAGPLAAVLPAAGVCLAVSFLLIEAMAMGVKWGLAVVMALGVAGGLGPGPAPGAGGVAGGGPPPPR